ncbi:MAG: hypothetical protein DRJ65_09510 [Acidobacteria bacterium]|nr:MAG: hypothetical protein DRJ65_09510 [Acidobacteriota bacterium]
MATPFVQGHLLDKDLSCSITTECAVSQRTIVFEMESDLGYRVRPPAEQPVLFIPMIDLPNLDAPCIVDDF